MKVWPRNPKKFMKDLTILNVSCHLNCIPFRKKKEHFADNATFLKIFSIFYEGKGGFKITVLYKNYCLVSKIFKNN